jgi:hypothetical protein
VPDGTNEALEECPLLVGCQVAHQVHLPRRDELKSRSPTSRIPFVNTTQAMQSLRGSMDTTEPTRSS